MARSHQPDTQAIRARRFHGSENMDAILKSTVKEMEHTVGQKVTYSWVTAGFGFQEFVEQGCSG